jgi:hypothetical protein
VDPHDASDPGPILGIHRRFFERDGELTKDPGGVASGDRPWQPAMAALLVLVGQLPPCLGSASS